jgi:hypothetical protein
VTVWFGVLTLGIETEIFCEGVEEGSLGTRHEFEAEAFLVLISCEDAEFSFVGLAQFRAVPEHFQGLGGIGDMVIRVSGWIYVQCSCKFGISLESQTFVVAIEDLFRVPFAGFGGQALNGFLLMLAFTSDESLCLAGCYFLAWVWSMARIGT